MPGADFPNLTESWQELGRREHKWAFLNLNALQPTRTKHSTDPANIFRATTSKVCNTRPQNYQFSTPQEPYVL